MVRIVHNRIGTAHGVAQNGTLYFERAVDSEYAKAETGTLICSRRYHNKIPRGTSQAEAKALQDRWLEDGAFDEVVEYRIVGKGQAYYDVDDLQMVRVYVEDVNASPQAAIKPLRRRVSKLKQDPVMSRPEVFTIQKYNNRIWMVHGPAGQKGRHIRRDAQNAGDAAAIALQWATSGGRRYVIVGHDEAMKHIPESVRSYL